MILFCVGLFWHRIVCRVYLGGYCAQCCHRFVGRPKNSISGKGGVKIFLPSYLSREYTNHTSVPQQRVHQPSPTIHSYTHYSHHHQTQWDACKPLCKPPTTSRPLNQAPEISAIPCAHHYEHKIRSFMQREDALARQSWSGLTMCLLSTPREVAMPLSASI